jgi:hypothetical protein
MRRALVVLFTFLAGIYFFIAFFLPEHILVGRTDFQWTRYNDQISDVFQVILAVSVGLGVLNIFRIYGYQIIKGRKGWPNGLALIVAMLVMGVAGFWSEFGKNPTVTSFFQDFLFTGLYNNLGSAMFSLLAFYIAGAAYRSFRVQSVEAGLMMLAALVVMIGQIPLGFYVWHQFPTVRNWLMTQVSTPGIRAIIFGILVAFLVTAVRMWLSLERGSSKAGGR